MRVLLYDSQVRVPAWVVDLESFRRWSDDDAFPETGRFSYLAGEVWVDMSKEQLFSHNQVKSAINAILWVLVDTRAIGRYFSDGAFVSNVDADVSNQPDGTFVSTASVQQGRVRLLEGRTNGHVELEGSPDMVLEVVSNSSVEKDTQLLRQAYARAQIREYWLVDARAEPLRFDILRLTRAGKYTVGRRQAGWVYSTVFERWFRLTQQLGPDDFPRYNLEVQPDRPT
jgi:Uma2 family endonuclease